jgi:hypothetical protein
MKPAKRIVAVGLASSIVLMLGACAPYSQSRLGESGGTGMEIVVNGKDPASMFQIGKAALEESGCVVTKVEEHNNLAVLYCHGSKVGNGKLEIESLTRSSHRLTMWNSMPGMSTGSKEISYVDQVLQTIKSKM